VFAAQAAATASDEGDGSLGSCHEISWKSVAARGRPNFRNSPEKDKVFKECHTVLYVEQCEMAGIMKLDDLRIFATVPS
jgi:hypothetical protein